MTFGVVILPQAHRDIDRNAAWWAENHSIEQALRWSDAVYDQIETLAAQPESHGLSAENRDFSYEIRDKLIGLGSRPSYRAIFSVRGEVVYVLAVRRGAQEMVKPGDFAPPPDDLLR